MFDGRIISGITVFVAVAEAGSYSKAGEQVGLTRSGVSKAIARLEERTGIHLFDRTRRAFKLTAEGRLFLERVKPILDRLGAAATPRDPNEIRGHLRVSCDAAFGVYLLMPAIGELATRHPHLRIDLLVRDRLDNLIADGFDCAVRFGEPEFRNLEKHFLFESRIVTCASKAYVAAHGLPAEPGDLLDGHKCIRLMDDVTGKPLVWNLLDEAGEEAAISPECTLVVNDAPSLLAGLRANLGIVRALDFMVEDEIADGRLIEVLPEWNRRHWPAYVYAPERTHRSPALDSFLGFVRERFTPAGIKQQAPERALQRA